MTGKNACRYLETLPPFLNSMLLPHIWARTLSSELKPTYRRAASQKSNDPVTGP